MRTLVLFLASAAMALAATEYRAGVAAVDITPPEPIRLSGYGARTKPSEGKLTSLYTKALVIERGGPAQRVVIVTTDLIGLPRTITDVVAARVQKQYGIERGSLMFNSSHTHTGPYIRGNLPLLFEINDAERKVIDTYADRLTDALAEVVGKAILDLAPARISVGHGEAGFTMNRREPTPNGVKIGINPNGPMDRDVPVLLVTSPDGKTRAVLFGYACHNTTLTANTNSISGDYAAYAQQLVEQSEPGAVAMFVLLCGADQNPNPRGTVPLAQKHGEELAGEVKRVLASGMTPLHGRVRSALQIVELEFQPNDRATFEARLTEKNAGRVRHAQAMLDRIGKGDPIRRYPYPVQAISFGKSLTIVALGGETLVDYDLRIKREFAGRNLIVAGYSNDVMAYVPPLRVTKEGGYEVLDSMYYYGLPAPWADDTEERIMKTVHQVMARVR